MMQGRIYYGVGYPGDAVLPTLHQDRSKAEEHLDRVEEHLVSGLRLLTFEVVSVEPGDRAERERMVRRELDTLPAPPPPRTAECWCGETVKQDEDGRFLCPTCGTELT